MTGRLTGLGRARGGSRGQALVEFTLVVPIFALLVLGLVEGGRLVFAHNLASNAAREAARAASLQAAHIGKSGAACTVPTCPADTAEFRSNVLAAANRMVVAVGLVTTEDLHLTCAPFGLAPSGDWTGGNDCSSTNGTGSVVALRIVIPIAPLTPLFEPIFPASVAAAATMAIP